jgi:NAD(P)H dehydrogenase (quinone)
MTSQLGSGAFIDAVVSISANFVPNDAWGGNTGDGAVTFVDTRDLAEAIATVLVQGPTEHADNTYTITGPQALSSRRVAELISSAVGHEVRYHRRTASESTAFLASLGLPELDVSLLLALDQFAHEGTMSEVRGDLTSLTGRPARIASDWINEFAPTLNAFKS